MKFITKKMSQDKRQALDFVLWMCVVAAGGVAFILVVYDQCVLTALPIMIAALFFNLAMKNSKIGIKELKEESKGKDENKKRS